MEIEQNPLQERISPKITEKNGPIKKPSKPKLPKLYGSKQFLAKKFKELAFEGKWHASFGKPEDNFSMILFGQSGNGKTEAEVQLCKYLCQFGNVYFNSTEQGISRSLQTAWERNNMDEVHGKVTVAHKETYDIMVARLKLRKSAKVVFIDSIQHSGIDYEMWKELRMTFPKKIFVLISHAEGSNPKGAAAKAIRYDVDIKCEVKDFVMYPASRYGGGAAMVIYEDGYRKKMARRTGKKPEQIKLPV